MSYTYGDYFCVQIFGAIGFAALSMAGMAIFACLPLCRGKEDKCSTVRIMVQLMFPYVKKPEAHERNGKCDTTVFKYKIVPIALCYLCVVVSLIVANTVAIFWINFFIEESSSCNPYDSFDCFPIGSLSKLMNETALDCRKIENQLRRDIQCFRFGCNIGNAAGQATGALVFSWISASFFMWTIMHVGGLAKDNYKKYDMKNWKNCCKKVYVGIILVIFQIFCFSFWTGLMYFVIAKLFAEREILITCTFQIIIICIMNMFSFIMCWCCLEEEEEKRKCIDIIKTENFHVQVVVRQENVRIVTRTSGITISTIDSAQSNRQPTCNATGQSQAGESQL